MAAGALKLRVSPEMPVPLENVIFALTTLALD